MFSRALVPSDGAPNMRALAPMPSVPPDSMVSGALNETLPVVSTLRPAPTVTGSAKFSDAPAETVTLALLAKRNGRLILCAPCATWIPAVPALTCNVMLPAPLITYVLALLMLRNPTVTGTLVKIVWGALMAPNSSAVAPGALGTTPLAQLREMFHSPE